jgi:ABC-type polysaccharide/polyol phosphate transport system ATPase subunit
VTATGTNDEAPAIVVDRVSKTFKLPRERIHTIKERALHPLRRAGEDELRALRDVSFGVRQGEFFGVVGRNGSGKSTLLKCMAGIYGVDTGQIYVNGRVSTFIELGVGFNPDLPAKDNILINATMLGLSPREAKARTEGILEFAELQEFTDLKIKNYSSGMLVRLAFSVMIQVDAEILLVDEVLAVGDASFQQKCFDEFTRIRRAGTTVVLVTHDMAAVERFCDRAVLLEHGRLVEDGAARDVGRRYLELNFSIEAREQQALDASLEEGSADGPRIGGPARGEPAAEEAEEVRRGDGRAEIQHAHFEDEQGRRLEMLSAGEQAALVMHIRFNEDVQDPLFGFNLFNNEGDHVFAANNAMEPPSGVFRASEEIDVRFTFPNYLGPGRYHVTASVARSGSGAAWIDRREDFLRIVSTSTSSTGGLVDLPTGVEVLRGSLVPDTA